VHVHLAFIEVALRSLFSSVCVKDKGVSYQYAQRKKTPTPHPTPRYSKIFNHRNHLALQKFVLSCSPSPCNTTELTSFAENLWTLNSCYVWFCCSCRLPCLSPTITMWAIQATHCSEKYRFIAETNLMSYDTSLSNNSLAFSAALCCKNINLTWKRS
jgi:hypothetical protein